MLDMHVTGDQSASFPVKLELVATAPKPQGRIVCRAPFGTQTRTPVHLFAPGMPRDGTSADQWHDFL